ncbi:MAG: hypothetical protein ACK55Z_29090, partial [bacterium]
SLLCVDGLCVPMCIVLSLCALSSKRASLHKEAPASVSRDIECYTVLSDALATLSLGPSPLFSLTFPQSGGRPEGCALRDAFSHDV